MSEGPSGDEESEPGVAADSDPVHGSEGDSAPRSDIDPAVAAAAREELRTTFTYQVERLREIDTKAIEILKANLVLIGIVVTGGSIVVQTEFDLGGFLNPFTLAGGVLLLVSTGLAAVTYTASDLRGGLSIADVDAVIVAEHERTRVEGAAGDATTESTSPGFDERLLRSYAEWIDYNARVTAVNDLLATVTVLLVFLAFVYVVAGVAVGAAGLSAAESWLSFAVLTVLGGGFTWIAAHMDHLGPETRHAAASFDGVQLSKGADRTEAWSSLLAMLGREPPVESSPSAEPSEPSEERVESERKEDVEGKEESERKEEREQREDAESDDD
ncbi:hypothetical protein SAMN04488066_101106 [Halorubrum aquaticum]|uniref:Uncharacterized protein n=1 Tax=Halorubrum aquaticum TaxID=387340 RepID=A0A1I2Z0E1_9EURY|nr:hypothetical protein [Halorubrum aquaticum]SFH31313.1 hypothetical protein SAMN04488066_101106 [Halorubrum aquaticum]